MQCPTHYPLLEIGQLSMHLGDFSWLLWKVACCLGDTEILVNDCSEAVMMHVEEREGKKSSGP